jgi:hypothetical protein
MRLRGWLSLACGVSALSLSDVASASLTFPESLRQKLELDAIAGSGPGCQICHQDDVGGLKTATKPFGRALISAGTTGASIPSLLGALETLEADGTDSDQDGVADIAELRAGSDPNVGADGVAFEDVPLPETGCSLPRSGGSSQLGALLLLSVALACRARGSCRRAR